MIDCSIKSLPESFGKLLQLQKLEVDGCLTLQCLPKSFGKLLQLRKLKIYNCTALECLPESFGTLSRLEKLKIENCNTLQCLPESFGTLSQLKTLMLSDCKALQCLPESFGTLSRLETLKMWNCKALQCLPESFGTLSQLETLDMRKCKALQCLPESFDTLSRLQTLRIENCNALQWLPESFGKLSRLETLMMENCNALQWLPESFGKLLQLRKLDIYGCKALKCLPKSFGHLHRLENLSITRCHGLEEFSKLCGDLPTNLLELQVSGGPKIRFSVEQFPRLQRIHYLHISRNKDNISCGKTSRTEQQNIDCWKNSNWYGQATQQQHLTSLVRYVSQSPQVKSQNRDHADLVSDNNKHAPPQLSDVERIGHHFLARCESDSHMLQQAQELSLKGFWNLQELPQWVGNLGHLKMLELCGCANLQCLPDTIGNLQNLTKLEIEDCIVLKGLPSWLGNISSLTTLRVINCWMVEVIHMQGLVNLNRLEVKGCINLRSIIGFSVLPQLSGLMIAGCLNLRDLAVTRGCATFNSLTLLAICSCYQLCLPIVEHLSEKLYRLNLSLSNNLYRLNLSFNHDLLEASLDEENQTLPSILQHSCQIEKVLNAKTSPLLFEAVEKRVTDLLSTKDDCFSFLKLSHDAHVPSSDYYDSSYSFDEVSHETPARSPTTQYPAAVLCFVSAVYAVDFPMHIPPPETTFSCLGALDFCPGRRFDFGEEIHIGRIEEIALHPSYQLFIEKDQDYSGSSEALAKEGWMIVLDYDEDDDTGLSTEIFNIFCSEVIKQRWLSRAWTELPSQLCISEFSALDIANCQITKTSRHFNTYIMEEESGLTWRRRRCLFMDDHALLLDYPRKNSSKHGFLAYPGLHLDHEAGVLTNLYEMSISVSSKDKLNSRKLQEIALINEQEIPVALHTLLQINASHSTLAALENLRNKDTSFHFRATF